jgi:uncharacterized membrane protein YecN with MAPEG domain
VSPVPITSVIAAIFGVMLVFLSLRVGLLRSREKIWFLDGGNEALTRRIRAQGNFIEYVPLALLLVALVELGGGPGSLIWGLGAGLLAARVAHAVGVSRTATSPARSAGTLGTFAVLLVSAGWLLLENL